MVRKICREIFRNRSFKENLSDFGEICTHDLELSNLPATESPVFLANYKYFYIILYVHSDNLFNFLLNYLYQLCHVAYGWNLYTKNNK